MASGFRLDDRGRVSFAVVAVIILMGATVGAAYFKGMEKKAEDRPKIPGTEVNVVLNEIGSEIDAMAALALEAGLLVFDEVFQDGWDGTSVSELMDLYEDRARRTFDASFKERFNTTLERDGISVTVAPAVNGDSYMSVVPRYGGLREVNELGEENRAVPVGYSFHWAAQIEMEDVNGSMLRTRQFTAGEASISTSIFAVLGILDVLDLSLLESLISSMMMTLVFAKTYGGWTEELSVDLEGIPGPGEELEEPYFKYHDGFADGFGSDTGPFDKEVIVTPGEREIVVDLALILYQIRYLGDVDGDFIDRFLDKVHSNSLEMEGKGLTAQDLMAMIGQGSPNYVNVEALALELFSRMGSIPSDVNLILPQLNKMLDQGFMCLLGDDWDEFIARHIMEEAETTFGMFTKGKWVDRDWILQNKFLVTGYAGFVKQFIAMTLWHILVSYHLDRPDEVKAFVQGYIDSMMDDGLLKYIPDNITVPPGTDSWVRIELKGKVKKAVDEKVDLAANWGVPLLDLEFNGYTLIYLFLTFYERPEVDDAALMNGYEQVYDNWTTRLVDFIDGKDIDGLNASIEDAVSGHEAGRSTIGDAIDGLHAVDLTMNQTLNSSVQQGTALLMQVRENLTRSSSLMANSTRFFQYGEGEETPEWRELRSILAALDEHYWCFKVVLDRLSKQIDASNVSSPEHVEAVKAEDLMKSGRTALQSIIEAMGAQLDMKWERDVLVAVDGLVSDMGPFGDGAGKLYVSIGLLSQVIGDHDPIGLNGTVDDMAQDLAEVSANAKGFTSKEGETLSIDDILDDDRGVRGLMGLLKDNILDIRTDFLEELGRDTWVSMVPRGPSEDWTHHDTYDDADQRLLYQTYGLSRAALELKRLTMEAEKGSYQSLTPLEMWEQYGGFDAYAESSYLELRSFVLDAVAHKFGLLEEIFNTTEAHPGLAATLGHIRRTDLDHVVGPTRGGGVRLLDNISLDYLWEDGNITITGLRIFENTTSKAPEDIMFQYLNPFSEEWHDYYLTNLLLTGSGELNITLRFTDIEPRTGFAGEREIRATYSLDHSTYSTLPSQLPVVDIEYIPVSSLFKRLNEVEIDRNVFSNKARTAYVNFTYGEGDGHDGNGMDGRFRVQVTANTKTVGPALSSGLGSIIEALPFDEIKDIHNTSRHLTGVIEVEDNVMNDEDMRTGHVSVPVVLDLDELKTGWGHLTFRESIPILDIKVWRPNTFKAMMSETLLRSATGEDEVFGSLPFIEGVEQGFFFFEDEVDPVLPVFDVGEGDEEIAVPFEINNEALLSAMTPSITPSMFDLDGTKDFPKDDERLGAIYELTCKFTFIRDIPSDSLVVNNKGIMLLVDFDGGMRTDSQELDEVLGHERFRAMHLNYAISIKQLSVAEESAYNILAPRSVMEETVIGMLPPSEYKFARMYDFIPVYMQYFTGWRKEPTAKDWFLGEEIVYTWGKDPDLYHIPYRVIPLNLARGKIVHSLWNDLILDLSANNYTMNYFIPEIIKGIMREIEDLIGMVAFNQKFNVSYRFLEDFKKEASFLKDSLKFVKYVKEAQQMSLDVGDLRFSTPGAKRGYDLGANLYLGFDIGKHYSYNDSVDRNKELMALLYWVGFYSDVKRYVKMCMEIAKFYETFFGAPRFPESPKPQKPGSFSHGGYEMFSEIKKDYEIMLAIGKSYKKMMDGMSGRSASDYGPADLYRIAAEYGLTNDSLKYVGEVAWDTGYDIIDVALLHHRNGFSLEEIRAFKSTYDIGHKGAEGLTCIVDLGPEGFADFYEERKGLGIRPSEYCEFGNINVSIWKDIVEGMSKDIPKGILKKASVISFPISSLIFYDERGVPAFEIVDMAEEVAEIAGHESLFEAITSDRGMLVVLWEAARLRDDPDIIVMPDGVDGPHLYLGDHLMFGYALGPDVEADLGRMFTKFVAISPIPATVHIDIRWSDTVVTGDIYQELRTAAIELDPIENITTYKVIGEEETTYYRYLDHLFLVTGTKDG